MQLWTHNLPVPKVTNHGGPTGIVTHWDHQPASTVEHGLNHTASGSILKNDPWNEIRLFTFLLLRGGEISNKASVMDEDLFGKVAGLSGLSIQQDVLRLLPCLHQVISERKWNIPNLLNRPTRGQSRFVFEDKHILGPTGPCRKRLQLIGMFSPLSSTPRWHDEVPTSESR